MAVLFQNPKKLTGSCSICTCPNTQCFVQSYLELISLYKDLLARKREELRLDKERLENGVTKIAQASAQVNTCSLLHTLLQI